MPRVGQTTVRAWGRATEARCKAATTYVWDGTFASRAPCLVPTHTAEERGPAASLLRDGDLCIHGGGAVSRSDPDSALMFFVIGLLMRLQKDDEPAESSTTSRPRARSGGQVATQGQPPTCALGRVQPGRSGLWLKRRLREQNATSVVLQRLLVWVRKNEPRRV